MTQELSIPQRFIFQDQEIDFEITGTNVMVNATQMAKIFMKDVPDFLILKQTKEFILECLNNQNSGYLLVENEDDLVTSVQKSGTWMHRILALKFAAWLNPAFELWVYCVIDDILFGHYRELEAMLRKSADTRNKIDELREQLREDPRFTELENLELQDKQYQRIRSRKTNDQLQLFRNLPNS
jgi:hypothetical protein